MIRSPPCSGGQRTSPPHCRSGASPGNPSSPWPGERSRRRWSQTRSSCRCPAPNCRVRWVWWLNRKLPVVPTPGTWAGGGPATCPRLYVVPPVPSKFCVVLKSSRLSSGSTQSTRKPPGDGPAGLIRPSPPGSTTAVRNLQLPDVVHHGSYSFVAKTDGERQSGSSNPCEPPILTLCPRMDTSKSSIPPDFTRINDCTQRAARGVARSASLRALRFRRVDRWMTRGVGSCPSGSRPHAFAG